MIRRLKYCLAAFLIAFVGIQFIPIHAATANQKPEPRQVSIWQDSAVNSSVQRILTASCKNCHSSQTEWPWYSRIAPVSWMIEKHVDQARVKVDLSVWARLGADGVIVRTSANQAEEICDSVQDKSMPLKSYTLVHPSARLLPSDARTLCQWAAGTVISAGSESGK
jgi:hypothetical protein